jgi:hypothetical protein
MNGATVEFWSGNIGEELRRSVKRKRASIAQERRILRRAESAPASLETGGNPDLHMRCTGEPEKASQKADGSLKK